MYNKPQSLCNSNNIVYPSPYDTLYVEFTGGFNMNTGEALEPLPNINRITRHPNNPQPRSSHSVHWVEDQNQQTEYYDQNNYTDAITAFFPLNF